MVSAGISCSSGVPALLTGYTFVTPTNKVTGNGTFNSWCVHMQGTGSARLKIFRDDGTNYIFVGESDLISVVSGANNNLPCNITVQTNDLIGVYVATANISRQDTTPISYYKSGDISTNSLKSGWSTVGAGDVIPVVGASSNCALYNNIYVNSSTGNDTACGATSGTPVQTFARAYVLLNSGGTIHVLNSGADFSAETVTLNKSFYVDLNGSSGYFYGPKGA